MDFSFAEFALTNAEPTRDLGKDKLTLAFPSHSLQHFILAQSSVSQVTQLLGTEGMYLHSLFLPFTLLRVSVEERGSERMPSWEAGLADEGSRCFYK